MIVQHRRRRAASRCPHRRPGEQLADFGELETVLEQPAAIRVVHRERRRPDAQPIPVRCDTRVSSSRTHSLSARAIRPRSSCHISSTGRGEHRMQSSSRNPSSRSCTGFTRRILSSTSSSFSRCRSPRPWTRTNSPASNSRSNDHVFEHLRIDGPHTSWSTMEGALLPPRSGAPCARTGRSPIPAEDSSSCAIAGRRDIWRMVPG